MWPNDILERLQQVHEAGSSADSASAPLKRLQVCLVSDDARTPLSSYTKEALQLRGGHSRQINPSRASWPRRHKKLRERNKARYPSSRWNSLPEQPPNTPGLGDRDRGLSSLHSVGRPPRRRSLDDDASCCSLDPPLKMPVRRGDPLPSSSSPSPSCLSLKMPVRQDSFVLRPVVALAAVRLPPASALGGVAPPSSGLPRRHHHHCGGPSAVEGKSTVDMISQVLADLDLIDADDEDEYPGDGGGGGNGGDCWTI